MARKLLEQIFSVRPDLERQCEAMAVEGISAEKIARELYVVGVDVSRGAVSHWLRDRAEAQA